MNSRLPSAFLIVISAGFFLSLQNQVDGIGERYEEENSDQESTSTTQEPTTTGKAKKVTSPRPTLKPEFVLSQVDKIIGNVQGGNIYGIIDESLGIRNTPVQNLVRGILRTVFCNPVQTILNLCPKAAAGGLSSSTNGNTAGSAISGVTHRIPASSGSMPTGNRPIGSGNDLITVVNKDKLSSVQILPAAGSKRLVDIFKR